MEIDSVAMVPDLDRNPTARALEEYLVQVEVNSAVRWDAAQSARQGGQDGP